MKDTNLISAEFINKVMQIAVYKHKEGTKTSYGWLSGVDILPNTLTITKEGKEVTNVQRKGRNLFHQVVGQLLGGFTKKESSILKQHKPFKVRTQLWQMPCYPLFSYGTLGITGASGKVEGDTGDLVVLYSEDHWEHIVIFYFAGMGTINDTEQVMKYLCQYVSEEIQDVEQRREMLPSTSLPNGLIND